jgi:hypothetical protein
VPELRTKDPRGVNRYAIGTTRVYQRELGEPGGDPALPPEEFHARNGRGSEGIGKIEYKAAAQEAVWLCASPRKLELLAAGVESLLSSLCLGDRPRGRSVRDG